MAMDKGAAEHTRWRRTSRHLPDGVHRLATTVGVPHPTQISP
jgi:hypothetical protein